MMEVTRAKPDQAVGQPVLLLHHAAMGLAPAPGPEPDQPELCHHHPGAGWGAAVSACMWESARKGAAVFA